MFSQLKNIKDLMAHAKQIKTILDGESAEGSAGFGKVKVVVSGNQEVLKVEIDEALLHDKTKTEDAVKDATNDALKKIQKIIATKMQQSGQFDLPGLGM
jgi:hypothetical protein